MVERVVNLLDHASLFLCVASEDEIHNERLRLEELTGQWLAPYRVTHETRSGAKVTRVEWVFMSP